MSNDKEIPQWVIDHFSSLYPGIDVRAAIDMAISVSQTAYQMVDEHGNYWPVKEPSITPTPEDKDDV